MTINGVEYTVLQLLGKGKGGYSYLVERNGQHFVLKQIHHEPCDYYQFGDKLQSELTDYERLRRIGVPMPELLEVDRAQERILKVYIEGETVDRLVAQERLPDWCIPQMEALCERLYAANTNIDYYPTNFIPQDGTLLYVDYECNNYMEQWDFAHWGKQYWRKQ
ncbi:MAG: hypothetical protein E7327_01450 [Clostridiales bacterium]|nr:hypothetical protein [Clostridiales bacterium]